MTFGSLFTGIGGFDLGFERAGFITKWQVEIDPFACRVLAKHWPNVIRYRDVRVVDWSTVEPVDAVCGGFPCQDISSSNESKIGLAGAKSGLFGEVIRMVRESPRPPRWLVLENVSDLLVRGMGDVLGALADVGYDAEWDCLPAAAFGLPQPRWRVFIIAYPCAVGCEVGRERVASRSLSSEWIDRDGLAEAEHQTAQAVSLTCGMDDGLPGTVDRVAALGNAVVPQIAEWIAKRLIEAEGRTF